MTKPLLLVASFGTTRPDTARRNIEAVETHLARCFPGREVRRAYTSGMVRRALAGRGFAVDSLPDALARARGEGVRDVAVLPTLLLYGEEYDKLEALVRGGDHGFDSLALGKPLLAGEAETAALAGILAEAFPRRPGRCVVFMGHGARCAANAVYTDIEREFRRMGREDVFVGTVEAEPGVDEIVRRATGGGFAAATLAPLMLVAGEHAENDLAGDEPESWKSRLAAAGVRAEPELRGLGEYPAVREIYAGHAWELVGRGNRAPANARR